MLKKILVLITLIFSYSFNNLRVYGETENNIGFSIKAILPDNQIDKNQSFFNLRMKANQKQTINIQISNSSNEDSNFKVNVNQAYTNKAGFIDYTDSSIKKDKSLSYDISNIVNYDSDIRVKANSTILFPIDLKMPEKVFDGTIMAGIQIIKKSNDNNSINNNYGYILGLKLTETDRNIKRKLNLLSISPAISFNRTSVVAKLQNPTMDAYGHLKYDAKIINKKTGKLEKEVQYDKNMQLAPNSSYDFAIDWDNKKLSSGEYTLNLLVSDAKNNKWKFLKNFTISQKEANEVNKVIINKNETISFKKIIAIILIILFVIMIIFYKILSKKTRTTD